MPTKPKKYNPEIESKPSRLKLSDLEPYVHHTVTREQYYRDRNRA